MRESGIDNGLVKVGDKEQHTIQLLTPEQILALPIGKLLWNCYEEKCLIRNSSFRKSLSEDLWCMNSKFSCWGLYVVPNGLEDEENYPR